MPEREAGGASPSCFMLAPKCGCGQSRTPVHTDGGIKKCLLLGKKVAHSTTNAFSLGGDWNKSNLSIWEKVAHSTTNAFSLGGDWNKSNLSIWEKVAR